MRSLPPQGLFISSIAPQTPQKALQYLAPLPIYAAAGKALIAEDMALLQRLQLVELPDPWARSRHCCSQSCRH